MLDFLVSARDALERTARAVRAVRARAKTTAGDLATLGEAIVEALEATNERLTHIERLVGEAPPGSERTEIAMEELRSAVRRSAERTDGGRGASAAQ